MASTEYQIAQANMARRRGTADSEFLKISPGNFCQRRHLGSAVQLVPITERAIDEESDEYDLSKDDLPADYPSRH
jgi:hypothetical protein